MKKNRLLTLRVGNEHERAQPSVKATNNSSPLAYEIKI